eukprot:3515295-Rhodomonas_salina.1
MRAAPAYRAASAASIAALSLGRTPPTLPPRLRSAASASLRAAAASAAARCAASRDARALSAHLRSFSARMPSLLSGSHAACARFSASDACFAASAHAEAVLYAACAWATYLTLTPRRDCADQGGLDIPQESTGGDTGGVNRAQLRAGGERGGLKGGGHTSTSASKSRESSMPCRFSLRLPMHRRCVSATRMLQSSHARARKSTRTRSRTGTRIHAAAWDATEPTHARSKVNTCSPHKVKGMGRHWVTRTLHTRVYAESSHPRPQATTHSPRGQQQSEEAVACSRFRSASVHAARPLLPPAHCHAPALCSQQLSPYSSTLPPQHT